MPLGEKLGKPFGLLSLICRKKDGHQQEQHDERLMQQQHHRSNQMLPGASSTANMGTSNSNGRRPFGIPMPPTSTTTTLSSTGTHSASGYAGSSIQYERLTPVGDPAPPTAASEGRANFPSPSMVQYEPLRPASSTASMLPPPIPSSVRPPVMAGSNVQYERITPSLSFNQHAPHVNKSSPSQVEPPLPAPMREHPPTPFTDATSGVRHNSPLYDHLSPAPLPVSRGGHSPAVPPLQSVIKPLKPDVPPLRSDLRTGGNTPGIAGRTPTDRHTPAAHSDKSTPFSVVMEEWMSQLRTPTPDVTLLPSPYDFNKDTPTPMEKLDGFRHLQDALLPTPPPDIHDQTQNTKSSEYVLSSAARRPLVEDIASLCRDLISQDISGNGEKKLPHQYHHHQRPHLPNNQLPSPNVLSEAACIRNLVQIKEERVYDDDDYDEDKASVSGNSTTRSNSSQTKSGSKRRKMCTVEGCGNLSRSRGLCKAHGGGRRCSVEGCTRASQSGSLCITHGGGKRCTVEGCVKAAQSRGMCKAHGGGVRCRVEGCTKSSQGDGFCRTHGGGRRCGHPSGCTKWAQRNGMCMAHSEGKYGNSYRGRLYRMQQEQKQHEEGAAATSTI